MEVSYSLLKEGKRQRNSENRKDGKRSTYGVSERESVGRRIYAVGETTILSPNALLWKQNYRIIMCFLWSQKICVSFVRICRWKCFSVPSSSQKKRYSSVHKNLFSSLYALEQRQQLRLHQWSLFRVSIRVSPIEERIYMH